MVSTISPTFHICAARWSLSSNHFPSPAKGEFFFTVLQAGFAAHPLLLNREREHLPFKMLVWCRAFTCTGTTGVPCPFGFNPILAMAGAGRGEAVAQLLESLV